MFLKKTKILIYALVFLFLLSFTIPTFSFGIDKDSIYVWSNNSDFVPTSSNLTQETTESSQNNSR
jgi:hypothetical protein